MAKSHVLKNTQAIFPKEKKTAKCIEVFGIQVKRIESLDELKMRHPEFGNENNHIKWQYITYNYRKENETY